MYDDFVILNQQKNQRQRKNIHLGSVRSSSLCKFIRQLTSRYVSASKRWLSKDRTHFKRSEIAGKFVIQMNGGEASGG